MMEPPFKMDEDAEAAYLELFISLQAVDGEIMSIARVEKWWSGIS